MQKQNLNKLDNKIVPGQKASPRKWQVKVFYACLILLVIYLSVLAGINPIGAVALIAIFLYARAMRLEAGNKRLNLLNISFLFVIFVAVSEAIVKNNLPHFYIPFSLLPILATLLFANLQISLLLTVSCAGIAALLAKNNLYLGMIVFVSGALGSLLVIGARRRSQIIRAGFFVGLTQMACLFFIEAFSPSHWQPYAVLLVNGLVSGIIVAGVLPIFEYLFGVVTNISLLELSDFNHPLLRNMILKAPGTYHHSLVVGNLAEQACEQIEAASSLLARVGAYYHDIGKIDKAEYFSENQMPPASKHDELVPSMSKLVIMNHVKEGVDLARQYKLNRRIIEFIRQHHGTSLVYYFYRRALENTEQEEQVKEDVFRYPGPKPNSKETAVVLLADSVEAASRTLKTPTPAKIEELVHKIINNKFIDGQLDECDLTLRDLEKIASVFTRVLGGIYHARVTYPEKESESPPS